MFFVLLFLALLIYLIIEIIHYCKVKANVISRNEVKKAAEEKARNLKIDDPIISCDYCGAKVDTRIHKVCPQCGGAFDRDIEWTSKFNVKSEFIDEQTREIISQREEKAQEEAKKTLKRIRNTIFALVGINIFIFGVALIFLLLNPLTSARGNETIDKEFPGYVRSDYDIEGDGVICDSNGFKITLTGIYTNPKRIGDDGYYGSIVMEFQVENNTGKDVSASLYCAGNSGMSRENLILFYDNFRKNKTVKIYEQMYLGSSEKVSELVFNELRATTTKNYEKIYELKDPVKIKTTSNFTYPLELEEGSVLIFSNDMVDIYRTYNLRENDCGYVLTIINKSDKDLTVSSDNLLIDGAEEDSSKLRKDLIPTGYWFKSNDLSPINSDYSDLSQNDTRLSLNFSCKEDPALGFSTGYLDLNQQSDIE
ncbi:hypothetical protein SAMN02745247_01589 [Butyrivibrio hungatei DSM 14810]|uniref:Uncharacterized protein n=1 Tax=Butyrivibrio hungatei DSM 14810 TaxID=1121132 RepID=A0A1M7SEB0_9FIRM|nr:hypothetical protein [Butyrivibrio hungatei]SHN56828.1 hypothetical protein SAMN02745247_01589 [Butyrivibrio hungatei DSM 14810]